jgi:hypothetical protein
MIFRNVILISAILFNTEVSGQRYDFVKILPGQGIVFNNDSILLYKSTVKDICKFFKIKDNCNPNEIVMRIWDGYDPVTGESISGVEYTKDIKFKSIVFEFSDESNRNQLLLKWIRLRDDKMLKIYTDNGLVLGMINPKLKDLYPVTKKQDFISENQLTYNLYTYGISFQLEKLLNNDFKLIEVSTHYKIK